jgi:hypothetical protein
VQHVPQRILDRVSHSPRRAGLPRHRRARPPAATGPFARRRKAVRRDAAAARFR